MPVPVLPFAPQSRLSRWREGSGKAIHQYEYPAWTARCVPAQAGRLHQLFCHVTVVRQDIAVTSAPRQSFLSVPMDLTVSNFSLLPAASDPGMAIDPGFQSAVLLAIGKQLSILLHLTEAPFRQGAHRGFCNRLCPEAILQTRQIVNLLPVK